MSDAVWSGIQGSLTARVAERDIRGVEAEGHLERSFWPPALMCSATANSGGPSPGANMSAEDDAKTLTGEKVF